MSHALSLIEGAGRGTGHRSPRLVVIDSGERRRQRGTTEKRKTESRARDLQHYELSLFVWSALIMLVLFLTFILFWSQVGRIRN
jgi:hypothetical protein